MKKLDFKTPVEIKIMAEGGAKLAVVRDSLAAAVKAGMTGVELDSLADILINQSGGKASFKMVPGYHHSTCINVNEEVVHSIPTSRAFEAGDIIGIDVGIYYKGFHTDTAVTVAVNSKSEILNSKNDKFLQAGRMAVKNAIKQAKAGKRVADLSAQMQKAIEGVGYSVVRSLTGHGVGRELHEDPAIPGFVSGRYEDSLELVVGMVLAIEIMYNEGVAEIGYKNRDGWTLITADGKISGLFEETVAITSAGPIVLTQTH
ncbi:MAG: type I methionyl aminopeptidase [Patescibacteria group bacterium]|mgnify:CR=1 FL=1